MERVKQAVKDGSITVVKAIQGNPRISAAIFAAGMFGGLLLTVKLSFAKLDPENLTAWPSLVEGSSAEDLAEAQAFFTEGVREIIFGAAKQDLAPYTAMKAKLAKLKAIDEFSQASLQKIDAQIKADAAAAVNESFVDPFRYLNEFV